MISFLSCFSGVEAASVAWHPLGWECVGVAEREPFPCALLAHHYPHVPNLGDVTADDFLDRAAALKPRVLVGGPPCQDFSVAGLRAGIYGDRGNLTLRWIQIIHAARPDYVVTENVPGWLSANNGHAFGAFLAGLVGHDTALVPTKECGGRWTNAGMVDGPKGRAAWRILDAQFFGLAQRRKRVFIVFCPRNGGDPAAVLFEPASMSWHPPPSRTTREGTSPSIIKGASIGRKPENGPQCGQDERGVRNATVLLDIYNIAMPLRANDGSGNRQAFAIAQNQLGEVRVGDISNTLNTNANASGRNTALTLASSAVRRLTPRECERLQGFPDDYTLIPYRNGIAADGPRYKALGNSMAVPVMAWIGRRIAMVDDHS